jgi:hypothetical protein
MRRLMVLTLVAGLAIGAADAAYSWTVFPRTPGSQFVEVRNGNGRAVISRRGSVIITVARFGVVRLVDLPGNGHPNMNCNKSGRRISATTLEYAGSNLRCRVSSGQAGAPWQSVVRGRGIFVSGVVKGSLTLDAFNSGRAGTFRIGSGGWRVWPRSAHTYVLRR